MSVILQGDSSYGRKSMPWKQRKNNGGKGNSARSAYERVVDDMNVSFIILCLEY